MDPLVPIIFIIDESITVPRPEKGERNYPLYVREVNRRRGRFSVKPTLNPFTFSEHLSYFRKYAGVEGQLVYLYDPGLTVSHHLDRIKNLLYPEIKLRFISGTRHRALNAYFISFIIEHFKETKADGEFVLTIPEQKIFHLMTEFPAWIISIGDQLFNKTSLLYRFRFPFVENEERMMHQKRKFTLYRFSPATHTVKRVKRGDPITLWNTLLAKRVQNQSVWVVERGDAAFKEGSLDRWKTLPFIRWISFDEEDLSNESPFLHILFIPNTEEPKAKDRAGEENYG